jgi:Protein of unknown function (DUF1194)
VKNSKDLLIIAPLLAGIGAQVCRLARVMASRMMPVLLLISPAFGQDRVLTNLELVLAIDCSASVDKNEFATQVAGIAAAFQSDEVQAAVEKLKPFGVAVSIVQWGSAGQSRIGVPFIHLESGRDAKAFGFRAGLMQRWMWANHTSIASAISDATQMIEGNEFRGQRKVIDVSGDGRDNGVPDLEHARRMAREAGIAINGLAIEADDDALTRYYEENVKTGADAFVERARNYEDFARAIREKLVRELSAFGS